MSASLSVVSPGCHIAPAYSGPLINIYLQTNEVNLEPSHNGELWIRRPELKMQAENLLDLTCDLGKGPWLF